MNNKFNKTLLAALTVSLLAGCGSDSSGGDNSINGFEIKGSVFNLANTQVFLDLNQNNLFDLNEVSTTTDANGNYSLFVSYDTTSSVCHNSSPIVANVTTSSTKVDTGEAIEGQYTLSRPPRFSVMASDETNIYNQNVTYLTTMAWEAATATTEIEGQPVLCSSEKPEVVGAQISSSAHAKRILMTELNVSNEDINSIDVTDSHILSFNESIEANLIANQVANTDLYVNNMILRSNGNGSFFWDTYSRISTFNDKVTDYSEFVISRHHVNSLDEVFNPKNGTITFKREYKLIDSVAYDYQHPNDIDMFGYIGATWDNGTCYKTETVLHKRTDQSISGGVKMTTNGISTNNSVNNCDGDGVLGLDFANDTDYRREAYIRNSTNGHSEEDQYRAVENFSGLKTPQYIDDVDAEQVGYFDNNGFKAGQEPNTYVNNIIVGPAHSTKYYDDEDDDNFGEFFNYYDYESFVMFVTEGDQSQQSDFLIEMKEGESNVNGSNLDIVHSMTLDQNGYVNY